MTQGEAVYNAVVEVLGEKPTGKVELTDAQLAQVEQRVFLSFKTGETVHSKNPSDEALNKYIPGLVNNWLRKDLRLNGGSPYQAKNPGSRSGSGDEAIKAMKTLLSMTTDIDAREAIQTEIDKRLAEIKPKAQLDIEKLPESLRQFVKQ
jgi:hypothetical protein